MSPTLWTPDEVLDKPGVWSGVPEHVYHGLKLCSSSNLKNIVSRSPYAAKILLDQGSGGLPSSAMRLGTAMHIALLEPDQFQCRVQSVGDSFNGKAANALAVELMDSGGVALNNTEHFKALKVWQGAGIPEDVGCYLDALTHTELTIIREIDGVLVKHRIDGWDEADGVLLDVKTGQVDEHSIRGKLYTLGYDMQLAMYHDALEWWLGEGAVKIVTVVTVCQEHPVEASLRPIAPNVIETGRQRYQRAISTWAECERTGVWPYAKLDLTPIDYLPWAESAICEEVNQ